MPITAPVGVENTERVESREATGERYRPYLWGDVLTVHTC